LKYLLPIALLLVGCAHPPKHYSAPSPAAVVQSLDKAKASASNLKKYVKPEGMDELASLQNHLDGAYKSLLDYSIKVDDLSKQLAKAQDDVVYWHGKQVKALKELWLWRGIAIASVLAVVGWFGLKTSWRFFL
jgi:hypothetical protein